MAKGPNILVVGSINMDLVVRADRMPSPGQTVLGTDLTTSPGGKGANQAVAAARLGGSSRMIGRIGEDTFGTQLLENLKSEGVDCTGVMPTPTSSGVAIIIVDSLGENSIVVASGANYRLCPDDIYAQEELFVDANVVVVQLELPLPTVRTAMNLAHRYRCRVILDPAPVPRQMPDELFNVDIISPNVVEAHALTGTKCIEERVDKSVALDLIARGAKAAAIKLGPRGSMVVISDGHFYRIPPYKVRVVDTTAAGDAFTAAIAVATANGVKLHQAAKFANAAGALACTRIGAQSAMPTAAEVKILMEDQPI